MKSIFSLLILALLSLVGLQSCIDSGNNLPPLIKDPDGHGYNSIKIGSQTWLLQPFTATHYNNSDPILSAPDGNTWTITTVGAYCTTSHSENLYNHAVIDDPRGIAPTGYRVATEADYDSLMIFSGSSRHLMAGLPYWDQPNPASDNSTGWTAIGLGHRTGTDGTFQGYHQNAYYWCGNPPNGATARYYYFDQQDAVGGAANTSKRAGCQIRFVKN
jgi:uncharacterized protein (TIGR02145 family)